MAIFSAPIVLAVAVDAWYDCVRYGSPFKTGYARYDSLGFTFPLLKGIYGLLLSPGVSSTRVGGRGTVAWPGARAFSCPSCRW